MRYYSEAIGRPIQNPHLKQMAFTLYFVDADLAEPCSMAAGAGAVCNDLKTARQERDRLEANPRYVNVRITSRVYGDS